MPESDDGAKRGRPRIVDNRGQVRQVFQNLVKHFDLVADALSGAIEGGDKNMDEAIQDLSSINVLLPYGEGTYHLNPNLRSFLKDHLNQFNAFETLTRITPIITRARLQWNELRDLQSHGEIADAERVEESLDFTITEIIHSNQRNLMLLTSLLSSEYGNVASLRAKMRQNEYYRRQIIQLLRELISVNAFIDLVNQELHDRAEVSMRARQMIRSRLSGRYSHWITSLNDIQAIISRRLFLARKLAQRLFALSQASLWLSRHSTCDGFEVEPGQDVNLALVRPIPIKVRPQIDVADHEQQVEESLEKAVRLMPSPRTVPRLTETREIQRVCATANRELEDAVEPADTLIMDLVQSLHATPGQPVSLVGWAPGKRTEHGIGNEAWVLYAAGQLALYPGIRMQFQMAQRDQAVINDIFHDILVQAEFPALKRAAA